MQPIAQTIPTARKLSGRRRSQTSAVPPTTINARSGEQRELERLVEHEHAERDGDERRGADDHRGPRCAGVADGKREEELRDAGREQSRRARRAARSRTFVVARSERRCSERDEERDERGGGRSEPRVGHAKQAEPHGDGHRAEERGRAEREEDRPSSAEQPAQRVGGRRLGDDDPGHDQRRARPPGGAEPIAREPEAEERRPRRLHREGERGARS